jgi:signal recognition particle subunit SRP54
MTPAERENPKIINGSRRLRIANGSGVKVSDVNQLVDRFFEARKMMSQLGGSLPGMRRSATRSKGKKGKKGKSSGRGPTQARMPAGFNPAGLNPAGFNPAGFNPEAFGKSGAFGALPPGMDLPDLSKLNLPKQ